MSAQVANKFNKVRNNTTRLRVAHPRVQFLRRVPPPLSCFARCPQGSHVALFSRPAFLYPLFMQSKAALEEDEGVDWFEVGCDEDIAAWYKDFRVTIVGPDAPGA